MSDFQTTIKKEVSYEGRGLHTGNKTKITFKPAPVNYGRKFVRVDIDKAPEIEAIKFCRSTMRLSTLATTHPDVPT